MSYVEPLHSMVHRFADVIFNVCSSVGVWGWGNCTEAWRRRHWIAYLPLVRLQGNRHVLLPAITVYEQNKHSPARWEATMPAKHTTVYICICMQGIRRDKEGAKAQRSWSQYQYQTVKGHRLLVRVRQSPSPEQAAVKSPDNGIGRKILAWMHVKARQRPRMRWLTNAFQTKRGCWQLH